ncbi:MAG: protein kinase [Gemmatimonadales bacterium]|nr:protein kinase [Gemmatimonadales bacterium]
MKTCPVCGRDFPDNVKFCPNDGQTLRAKSASADLVGQVVADRYHITKKLGEGGMGAVYLGEHVKMGRKSAIKVMTQAMVHDPDAVSRFNREAANASRISHANVCQIYDFGETSDGLIYLAMEFIEGCALTDLVDREGALPPARAAAILKQAADALQAAHDLSIVHRDLKPDNIMIVEGRDGTDIVKVVDFGIAKAMAGDETGQKVTKTGLVVGTPEYMSPEQLSGDKLDGRSDIYSLGLVLYRMLTGVLPFQADSAQETMIKRLTDDPTPLVDSRPDIVFPDTMQAVLDKALARSPSERYQSAAEFGRDTMEAVAGLAVPSTRVDVAPANVATQLMTEDHVEELTKNVAAKKKVAPAAAAAAPAPAKKFPLVPVLGGVGGVAVLGAVAVLAMGRGRGDNVTDSAQTQHPNSLQVAAANPNTTPTVGRPIPNNPPRPRPDSGGVNNPPRPDTAGRANPPPAPGAVSIADSLRQMDDLVDAQSWDAARRTGTFIWTSAAASGSQKARAARTIANTFGEQGNNDQMINWYRNSLRYDPNNASVLDILNRLGVNP